jgi:hypothetical protein
LRHFSPLVVFLPVVFFFKACFGEKKTDNRAFLITRTDRRPNRPPSPKKKRKKKKDKKFESHQKRAMAGVVRNGSELSPVIFTDTAPCCYFPSER